MQAKYTTTCKACGSTISAGTEIVKSGPIWKHQSCPTANVPVDTVSYDTGYVKYPPHEFKEGLVFTDRGEDNCGHCGVALSQKGNRWRKGDIRSCEKCFDNDIKLRWGYR